MNVHKNARLTPSGRALLVDRVLSGRRIGPASEAAGVSVRTGYKWLARYRQGGPEWHRDYTSSPSRCPHRTPEAVIREIDRLRRRRMSGMAIASMLGTARSTVGLILRRLGLNRLALLEPKAPVVRYERARPGELIHIDIKTLGEIDGIGQGLSDILCARPVSSLADKPFAENDG